MYERVVAQLKERTDREKSLATLHVTMRADLHRRLVQALETLSTDSKSLRGAFSRWRSRAKQKSRMLRAVDELTGANDDETEMDETMHAGIVEVMDRTTPAYEIHENVFQEHARKATAPRKKQDVLDRAMAGTLRPGGFEDAASWKYRDDESVARRWDDDASFVSFEKYDDDATFVSNLTT